MKNEIISEIILTSDNVEKDAWLSLFNSISKLNGIFKTCYFYAKIDLNEVHYYIKTSRILPPIISSLGDFMIKKLDISEDDLMDFPTKTSIPFIVTNKERNLLDVFDKLESSTKGYASLDYEIIGYRTSKLQKMDILCYN